MSSKSPGVSGLESVRYNTLEWLRTNITASNLVGLIGGVFVLVVLLVLHEPWNIRLPLYAVVLVWTILQPRAALYLTPIAVPWGSLDYIDIGALRLNSADLLVIFLVIGWLLSFTLPARFARGAITRLSSNAYAGPLDREASNVPPYLILATLALLGTMLLSTLVAINISDSLKEISKWLEFLALVLVGTQYIRTRRQIWIIVVLILLAGISQAIYGYTQAFYSIGPANFIRDASLRVYGTFGQPNPFAGYLNIALSIALALMLLGRNWMTRVLAGLAAVLLFGAEFLTQSRGGEIALAVVVLFILIVGIPAVRVILRPLIVVVLGAIAATLAGLIPTGIFTPALRILGFANISFTAPTPQDYSTAERLAHWIAGLRMFFDHPILGVGIGNYPDAYAPYHVTIFVNSLGHAHNYYINVAAEMGFIGLVVYLLFLLGIFVAGGHVYRIVNQRYKQAKAQQSKPLAPLGTRNKVLLLLSYFGLVRCEDAVLDSLGGSTSTSAKSSMHRPQRAIPMSLREYQSWERLNIVGMLTNDRALAIGLLAALLSIAVHNFVDDLYVHSLTNLIALLLIALIRLERVTSSVSNHGG
jgi:O-antigen ligase